MSENTTPKPDNFLVWAILSTVLCCVPTGIAAIVFATKVDSEWNAGNHQAATDAAKNARLWSFISLGAGVLMYIVAFMFGLIGAMMS